MDGVATAVALSLFPSLDHRAWSVGPYAFEQDSAPLLIDGLPSGGVQGIELMTRRVWGTSEQLAGLGEHGTQSSVRLRMVRTDTGGVGVEWFEMENLFFNLRVRPEMGDDLDLGLFFGRWDRVLFAGDTGRSQWMLYSPQTVTLLGLSKSDMGTEKLRYYAEAGIGLGGETLTRVVGPFGLQLRAEVEGTARRRRERTSVDYTVVGGGNTLHHSTRQQVSAEAEVGLAFMRGNQAWVLGAWGQHVTQWEPLDQGGADGVDRQYFAAGARLTGRLYKESERSFGPEVRDLELQELLEAIQREQEGEQAPGAGPSTPYVEPEPELILPLEVHWSEVSFVEQPMPTWPAGTPEDFECGVQLYVDPTGLPFLVEPEQCPAPLVESSVQAAERWRVEPIVSEGETVSARFVYTLSADQVAQEALPSGQGAEPTPPAADTGQDTAEPDSE